MEPRNYVGFIGALFNSLLAGNVLSFNVYAVELKEKFSLNQTQVDLLASFCVIGMAFAIAEAEVYKRFGSKPVYIISCALVTSSGLLMWVSTLYVDFFRSWLAFMCFFQLCGAAGTIFGHQCCMAVAMEKNSKQHTAKLTGLFAALTGLGKAYYSAVMTLLDHNIGHFFLLYPVPVSISLVICFLFHNTEIDTHSEKEKLIHSHDNTRITTYTCFEERRDAAGLMSSAQTDRKQLLTSGFFHVMCWSGVLFHSCTFAFINNLTHIAKTVDLKNPLHTVYVLSVFIAFFRLTSGFIFDKLSSKKTGLVFACICHVTFGFAMAVGLFWLNGITIYVMTVLASVGAGAIFCLIVSLITSEFGKEHYSFVLGMYFTGLGIFTVCVQVIVGRTVDRAVLNNAPQNSHFFAMYVMLLGMDVVMLVLYVVYFFKLSC